MDSQALSRERYQPSGNIGGTAFFPLGAVILVFSVAVGGFLDQFLRWYPSFDWFFLIPILLALAIARLIFLVIVKGNCRNPILACLLGLAAGVVFYFGAFYIGMVRDGSSEALTEPSRLPEYIDARMHYLWFESTPGMRDVAPAVKGEIVINWLAFAAGLGIVLGVCGFFAYRAGNRAFCETCGKWMKREYAGFLSGSGSQILNALRENRLEAVLDLERIPPPTLGSVCVFMLEVCPAQMNHAGNEPSYISVKQMFMVLGSRYGWYDLDLGGRIFHQLCISPAEVGVLSRLFSPFGGEPGATAASGPLP